MRGDGTRILHGKSYCSKLSPPFAKEYSDFSVYPTGRFSPLFWKRNPSHTLGQNYCSFCFAIEYVVKPLGNHRNFLPGKNQFHDFFGILLPPKPITNVAVMAAKLLLFGLALKFFSTEHTLMLVKRRMVFHPQSAAFIKTINPFSSAKFLL